MINSSRSLKMYEMQVEKMHCGGCAAGVKRAVATIDPHAAVTVDLTTKTVQVQSACGPADIQAAIHQAGFPVVAWCVV